MKAKCLYLFALVLMLFLCSCQKEDALHALRMGTGGAGGNYYTYGQNLDKLLRDKSDYGLDVRTTSGSAANLRLLSQGFLDLAITQGDTLKNAIDGRPPFDRTITGFHAVTGLYTESCQFVVGATSGVKTLADLVGKRVSLGEEESGGLQNALQILEAAGLSRESIAERHLSFTDAAKALMTGEIDAFFVTAGFPTRAVSELAQKKPIRLLSLDEATVNKLRILHPTYVESNIPAGTYLGQEASVRTVGVPAVLVAANTLPVDVERTVVTLLTEKGDHLQKVSFAPPPRRR